jgi:hypothetical protein
MSEELKPYMKDHKIAQFTNELRDIAKTYAGAEQLRSRISGVVSKYIASADRDTRPNQSDAKIVQEIEEAEVE